MEIIKKTLVVLILCSFIMGTVPISVLAQQNSPDNQIFEYKEPSLSEGVEYAPGEFIVQFKPGVSNEKIASINSRHGTSVKYTSPYAGFKILHIPKGKSVPDMVEIYSKNPNVEYVVTNSIAHAFMSPNDPLYHYQWHLDDSSSPNPYGGTNGGGINIEPAWDISNGTGVVIAVLDTGVAYENYGFWYQKAPDLANTHFVAGWDFVNNDAHPNDDNSHGTHVTGTIAQSTNNGIGVAGVAFNCSIMPVKVLNKKGSGTLDQLVDGIYFATDNGADVISMSLGWPPGYDPGQPLKDALDYAYINGVTIISASGNDAASQLCYPAAYGKCIAVGATRFDETRASYSNYGDALDIMAPGGDLSVDQNGDGYGDGVLQNTFNPNTNNPRDFNYWFFSGTSMATPHVSGVAALLIANGVTGPDNVREALLSTAEDKGDPGWDTQYGWGIVDAYAALQWSATPNNPPVANDQSVTIDEDTTAAITLTATDPDGDTLTYSILSGPSNGVLTGTAPTLTYTPNADYNGADSFAFKANDGTANSNIATVNITVNPVNDLPVADDQLVTTEENTPVAITLTATDPDGDTLTYSILSGPSNGVLTGTAPTLTYTPNADYNGADSFAFKVNDETTDSNIATVNITVNPVNDLPVADDQLVTTDEDTTAAITLTATDPDGDTLTYSILSGPSNGVLTGTAPTLTYTPNADYNGADSFAFNANDGTANSNIATVNITVNPVNDLPVADDQLVTTEENTPVAITLTATDPDGDTLTYSILSAPSNGVLTGTAPTLTCTPNADYNGADSFTFKVNDGTADSNTATVNITVTEAPTSPNMHINSIDMDLVSRYRGWIYYATTTVTIVDNGDHSVEGATVCGHWEDATTDSDVGMTDASGQVTLQSNYLWKPPSGTTFTFVVDDVVKDGWIYDNSANVETSDSISVN